MGKEMDNKMKANLKENAKEMNAKMDNDTLRQEMQQMGRSLQAGMKAIACNETRTTECIMAPPRAGTNEVGGVQRLSGPRWGRVRKN